MTINFTLFAQNSDVNYVKQAYACALSIKHTNPNSKICLITDDPLTEKQKQVFDYVKSIPWGDMSKKYSWKIQNRWKIYHITPFENTIVLDTDTLVLDDMSNSWNNLQKYDVYYTNSVTTYRGKPVTTDFYRKTFTKHNLPNIYSGFHYFKHSDWSKKFYEHLEIVVKDWKLFYDIFANGIDSQKFLSIDLCTSIVTKILECEKYVTSTAQISNFVHMKSNIQGWKTTVPENWMHNVNSYITEDLELYVGNYKQHGIFHYTVDEFLTDSIITKYENKLGIK